MSALATRMLVLGVVRLFEPANAYQLRRELLSWNVEAWANINPGSVYGMLASLEKAGLVASHALAGVNGRPVTVYTTTPAGAEEFPLLVARGLRDVTDWGDVTDLRAALAFVPNLPRVEAVAAVAERIERLRGVLAELERLAPGADGVAPAHVVESFGLESALAAAQRSWLEGFLERIEAGALSFAGEPADAWSPPEGDPGRTMSRDREHYRAQLRA